MPPAFAPAQARREACKNTVKFAASGLIRGFALTAPRVSPP